MFGIQVSVGEQQSQKELDHSCSCWPGVAAAASGAPIFLSDIVIGGNRACEGSEIG